MTGHLVIQLTPRLHSKRRRTELKEVNESICSDTAGHNVESVVTALEQGNVRCFDDVYNAVERIASTDMDIGDGVRESIQSCIEGDALKLKTFEKALLLQKVAEL